jgi:hypothetical protein
MFNRPADHDRIWSLDLLSALREGYQQGKAGSSSGMIAVSSRCLDCDRNGQACLRERPPGIPHGTNGRLSPLASQLLYPSVVKSR